VSAFPQAEDWAGDFAESTACSLLPDAVKDQAPALCAEFLRRTREPSEADVRRVLLEELPSLGLPPALRASAPETLAVFLGWLQDGGRLADGHALGRWIRALAPAYRDRCAPGGGLRVPPVVKKTADLGRNDPCPCGSGRKYKKCCAS
jgi:hypothetical protein